MNRDPWQKYALEFYQQQTKPIVDGNFNPNAYSPIVWFRADDVIITSGAVSQWNDKSGNARHATQGTAGNRPTQQLNIVNGRPVVRFDGNNYLKSTFGVTLTQPTTIFIVWSITSSNSALAFSAFDGISVSNRNFYFWQKNLATYAGSFVSYAARSVPRAFAIDSCVFNGANSQVRENGVLLNTRNPGTQVLTGLTIGVEYPNTSALIGDIAEIIVIQDLLSSTNYNKFLTYFQSLYGITTTPI